jgi:hypothetical protein
MLVKPGNALSIRVIYSGNSHSLRPLAGTRSVSVIIVAILGSRLMPISVEILFRE